MKSLEEFKKMSVEDKLDHIYHALTNHLSEHKVMNIVIAGIFIGVLALVLDKIF